MIIVWYLLAFLPNMTWYAIGDTFTEVKWLGLTAVAVVVGARALFSKSLSIEREFAIFFGGVVLAKLGMALFKFSPVGLPSFADLLAAGLVLAFIRGRDGKKLTEKDLAWPLLVGMTGVIGRAVWELTRCRMNGDFSHECFPSTFGQMNILGEYLLLLFPYTLTRLLNLKTREDRMIAWWSGAAIVGQIYLLWFTRSRSCLLGAAAVLGWLWWKKSLNRKHLGIMILSTVVIVVSELAFPISAERLAVLKAASAMSRWGILNASFKMFVERPWGWGLGAFEYGSIPFQIGTSEAPIETIVYHSPHTEFMRWLCEDGVLGTLLILLAYAVLSRRVWRDGRPWLVATLIAFLCQTCLQFPFLNPFPVVAAIVFLALLAPLPMVAENPRRLWLKKTVLVIATLFVLGMGLARVSLEWSLDAALVAQGSSACERTPWNWRVCLNDIRATLSQKGPQAGQDLAVAEMRKRPFNFVALRFYSISENELGHRNQTCETATLYDWLFASHSEIHDFVTGSCKTLVPVDKPDTETWLRLAWPVLNKITAK